MDLLPTSCLLVIFTVLSMALVCQPACLSALLPACPPACLPACLPCPCLPVPRIVRVLLPILHVLRRWQKENLERMRKQEEERRKQQLLHTGTHYQQQLEQGDDVGSDSLGGIWHELVGLLTPSHDNSNARLSIRWACVSWVWAACVSWVWAAWAAWVWAAWACVSWVWAAWAAWVWAAWARARACVCVRV